MAPSTPNKITLLGLLVIIAIGVLLISQTPTSAAPSNSTFVNATLMHYADIDLPNSDVVIRPVDINHSGISGDMRLFVVDKNGQILIVDANGDLIETPFLEMIDSVAKGFEQGLLGMAFHPDYANNGYFYINYTNVNGDTTVSRLQVSDDANRADAASEVVLFFLEQPFSNHNGGDLAFGPDGYLYIPTGDGGAGGDPGDRAQDLNSLHGKILRIDVDGDFPYSIPDDNPYADSADKKHEIWASGLRNPWRISFDRMTGDRFIADVGQGSWEEVSYESANSSGGLNFGWRCYEGLHPFTTAGCADEAEYVMPIAEYGHNLGQSITGGYLYRGTENPGLVGHYFYGDFSTGVLFSMSRQNDGSWTTQIQGNYSYNFSSFGEDINGELYVADYQGAIYKIVEKPFYPIFLPIIEN